MLSSINVPTMFIISTSTIIFIFNVLPILSIQYEAVMLSMLYLVYLIPEGMQFLNKTLFWYLFEMHFLFLFHPSFRAQNVSVFSPSNHLRLNGHFFNYILTYALLLSHLLFTKNTKCHWDFLPPYLMFQRNWGTPFSDTCQIHLIIMC